MSKIGATKKIYLLNTANFWPLPVCFCSFDPTLTIRSFISTRSAFFTNPSWTKKTMILCNHNSNRKFREVKQSSLSHNICDISPLQHKLWQLVINSDLALYVKVESWTTQNSKCLRNFLEVLLLCKQHNNLLHFVATNFYYLLGF